MQNEFNKTFFRQILIFLAIVLASFSVATIFLPYMEGDTNNPTAKTE